MERRLLKIIEEQLNKIEKLEARIKELENCQIVINPSPPPPIKLPYVQGFPIVYPCEKGGECEFPGMWESTEPQPCSKCGKANPLPKITFSAQLDCPSCPVCGLVCHGTCEEGVLPK